MREERYKGFLDPQFNKFLDRKNKDKTPLQLAEDTAGSSMVDKDLATAAKQFKYVFFDSVKSFAEKTLSFLLTFLVRST